MSGFRRIGSPEAMPVEDVLACRYCGRQASRETLSMLGARCGACYSSYIERPAQGPDVPKDMADSFAWIRRLEYRRDVLGERLTLAMNDALDRAAKRSELFVG